MWDELDQYLSSTAIMNMNISLNHMNHTRFGPDVEVDGDYRTWGDSMKNIKTKYKKFTIIHYNKEDNLIFIRALGVVPDHELCTIVLSPNGVSVRLAKEYYSEDETRYFIHNTTSEHKYGREEGLFEHFIDYHLICKLRHFRNFYDAYYFGEK